MLNLIKNHLIKIINDIDSGNSKISEEQEYQILRYVSELTRDQGMSKYSACQYLNISRATFDRYVKEGKIPKGYKEQGFKELRWYKKDLDDCIKNLSNKIK